jgi:hypothetical protein
MQDPYGSDTRDPWSQEKVPLMWNRTAYATLIECVGTDADALGDRNR